MFWEKKNKKRKTKPFFATPRKADATQTKSKQRAMVIEEDRILVELAKMKVVSVLCSSRLVTLPLFWLARLLHLLVQNTLSLVLLAFCLSSSFSLFSSWLSYRCFTRLAGCLPCSWLVQMSKENIEKLEKGPPGLIGLIGDEVCFLFFPLRSA
jgi:hypothetical protein